MVLTQTSYLIIIALCFAAFASASTTAYAALKSENVELNKPLETMRNVSLAQMIVGWALTASILAVAYTVYRSHQSILRDGGKMQLVLDFAVVTFTITASMYLGAYGSLDGTTFSSKKVVKNKDGEDNKKASSSILAAMVLNIMFIFIYLRIAQARAGVYGLMSYTHL
jgi:hypothetical protein